MSQTHKKFAPTLRFLEFKGEWKESHISQILKRTGDPATVDKHATYREIGIRSHGKGIFHKDPVTGESLGNKRVFHVAPEALIFNIVFAWEQALSVTSSAEEGFIASHRFPMYVPKSNRSDVFFLQYFFLRPRGKYLLDLASPGGAGRNKTLGQKDFNHLKVRVPHVTEQQKIASFLSAVDEKISQITHKKKLLTNYKKGCMQKIFSQKIRFKDDNGNDFQDWKEKALNQLMFEPKERNRDLKFCKSDVLSVSGDYGCVNQIEFMGRSYAGVSVKDYHIVQSGDIVYTKSPLKNNPYGIIKANKGKSGIVSTLYAVYRPTDEALADFIDDYFQLDDNLNRYLRPIVRKGAKNDMKVNNSDVLGDSIVIPNIDEQSKISSFLSEIDIKIDLVSKELSYAQAFKKGLLQQMFV